MPAMICVHAQFLIVGLLILYIYALLSLNFGGFSTYVDLTSLANIVPDFPDVHPVFISAQNISKASSIVPIQ